MLSIQLRSSIGVRTASTLAVFMLASAAWMQAQQVASPEVAGPNVAAADGGLFAAVNTRPMDLASVAGVGYSSSNTPVDASLLPGDGTALNFAPEGLAQPPSRRRYGSPRYSDKSHNADGSNKITFEAEAGLTLPIGNTFHYDNTSYAFGGGVGRNFNKKFAVMAKFDWDNFGLGKATLDNQLALYQILCNFNNPTCLTPTTLDGNAHVWSFSLNPMYTFAQSDRYGAYVVGGVGFYHKVTTFLTPQQGTYCDPFSGFCQSFTANATFDHYTSNAPGYSGGFGLTYKFSRFADERFFIEARYVFVNNPQRQGYTLSNTTVSNTNASGYTSTYSGNDAYPANSNRTAYVPVKVGIRF